MTGLAAAEELVKVGGSLARAVRSERKGHGWRLAQTASSVAAPPPHGAARRVGMERSCRFGGAHDQVFRWFHFHLGPLPHVTVIAVRVTMDAEIVTHRKRDGSDSRVKEERALSKQKSLPQKNYLVHTSMRKKGWCNSGGPSNI
jgi:hypothetical protein